MRYSKEIIPVPQIDGVADTKDQVVIRIEERQAGNKVLYVDVNQVTVLRLGHIRQAIEISDCQIVRVCAKCQGMLVPDILVCQSCNNKEPADG